MGWTIRTERAIRESGLFPDEEALTLARAFIALESLGDDWTNALGDLLALRNGDIFARRAVEITAVTAGHLSTILQAIRSQATPPSEEAADHEPH